MNTIVVSSTTLKNNVGSVLETAQTQEVLVKSRGEKRAVIMSMSAYTQYREMLEKEQERQKRREALETWRAMRKEIRKREAVKNLTDQDAERIAQEFSAEVLSSVVEKRRKRYG